MKFLSVSLGCQSMWTREDGTRSRACPWTCGTWDVMIGGLSAQVTVTGLIGGTAVLRCPCSSKILNDTKKRGNAGLVEERRLQKAHKPHCREVIIGQTSKSNWPHLETSSRSTCKFGNNIMSVDDDLLRLMNFTPTLTMHLTNESICFHRIAVEVERSPRSTDRSPWDEISRGCEINYSSHSLDHAK